MPRTPQLTRRRFLQGSAAATVFAAGARGAPARAARDTPLPGAELVIDCHAHLHHHSASNWKDSDRLLIEAADKLGIDQLCCSILTPKRPATVEGFRQCNAWLSEAVQRFPGRVLGYCYVNPGHTREALEEIRRYVLEHGFIGVKLYNEHTCTEPVVAPVVELAIELKVPILHHAGHMHYPNKEQPRISDAGHLAALAKRYPEATLICAHIGGGGDWEWTIKAARHAKNLFLDTSGSVVDEGIVDMAARAVGVDRLLFGCDMSLTAGVGKILAAKLSQEEKSRILGGNMKRILSMRSQP